MSKKEKKVAIFIPCYNEAEIIENTINNVRKFIESEEFPYRGIIVVVDDGSTDGSFEIARKAGAEVLYRHVVNLGLGAATRTGMEIAHYIGCDAFIKFDADLQHDIKDISEASRLLVEDHADILYASRFSGKIHYRMPLIRLWGNKFFTWFMGLITGWKITDAQTGMMCFGRRYLTIFEMPGSYNPPQQALFDACKKGMRYAEIPAQFYARKTGKSFISLKYIYNVLVALSKMAFYHYCFGIFFFIGILLLMIGSAVITKGLYDYYVLGTGVYAPHGIVILFSMTLGILAVLFGLQSYAQINRLSYIRNSQNYRYIIIEDVIIQSPQAVSTALRGPVIALYQQH